MSEWCPRCGGPVADGVCENCISAEERQRHHKEQLGRQRFKIWRWVERFTEVPPEQDPMSALLQALLVDASELQVLFGPDYRIRVVGPSEREVRLPAYVVRDLDLFLRACLRRELPRDRMIEIEVFAMDEHGRGVRRQTEHFVVASITGGYSVRLR